MSTIRICAAAAAATFLLVACVARPAHWDRGYLSEDEVVDLMRHPKKWDGRTVTIRIFPYDNGFQTSYVLCFEECDEAYAERSPFIILTSQGRFKGHNGKRAVMVTARYDAACFYTEAICGDNRFGEFTEIP